jgi:hypothetical protein
MARHHAFEEWATLLALRRQYRSRPPRHHSTHRWWNSRFSHRHMRWLVNASCNKLGYNTCTRRRLRVEARVSPTLSRTSAMDRPGFFTEAAAVAPLGERLDKRPGTSPGRETPLESQMNPAATRRPQPSKPVTSAQRSCCRGPRPSDAVRSRWARVIACSQRCGGRRIGSCQTAPSSLTLSVDGATRR